MTDPAKTSLVDICDAMYDITLSENFEQISQTDQRLFTDVYSRLKRRLNKVGVVTMEDYLVGALDADSIAAHEAGCAFIGATQEERMDRARQLAADNAGE